MSYKRQKSRYKYKKQRFKQVYADFRKFYKQYITDRNYELFTDKECFSFSSGIVKILP